MKLFKMNNMRTVGQPKKFFNIELLAERYTVTNTAVKFESLFYFAVILYVVAILTSPIFVSWVLLSYYPHLPIGKVWIYRLLFVGWFVCFCLFIRLRISPARIKIPASDFARWFIGILCRESHILGNVASSEAPPKAPNRTNRLRRPRWGARERAMRACARVTRRIAMCAYTVRPRRRTYLR